MKEKNSLYFVAKIPREKTWFVSGCIRNQGRIAFERSLSKDDETFEFYVPEGLKQEFVDFANYMKDRDCFEWWEERKNRLLES